MESFGGGSEFWLELPGSLTDLLMLRQGVCYVLVFVCVSAHTGL